MDWLDFTEYVTGVVAGELPEDPELDPLQPDMTMIAAINKIDFKNALTKHPRF